MDTTTILLLKKQPDADLIYNVNTLNPSASACFTLLYLCSPNDAREAGLVKKDTVGLGTSLPSPNIASDF